MLHRTLAAVLLCAALAAATGARGQELTSYIRHALDRMEAEWAGRSYSRSYFVAQDNLRQGAAWTQNLTSAAASVTLVAGCDQDCSGLSMTVFDRASGRVLDQRRGYGQSMQMTIYPGAGRPLIAVLTMEGCATEVCYFAFTAVH
ncbi:MAG TPA: hypothetical protein VGN74_13645 [Brevundimonas sp.]|jgi:hypothetical protein|uniref:hypothetical protein n=1 Tax=Brevundimonas sp. TaxID=1871086 RepID=UPI002E13B75C|nr:hypothetical protein [Brevundimonas sp.]